MIIFCAIDDLTRVGTLVRIGSFEPNAIIGLNDPHYYSASITHYQRTVGYVIRKDGGDEYRYACIMANPSGWVPVIPGTHKPEAYAAHVAAVKAALHNGIEQALMAAGILHSGRFVRVND